MAWTVQIGASFTVVEEDNSRFNIARNTTHDASGNPQTVTTTIKIEGDVEKSTPSQVSGRVKEWLGLPAITSGPINVLVKLDGNVEFQFLVSQSNGSPVVTQFETIDDEGNAFGHWRVALTIVVFQTAEQASDESGQDSDIYEFKGEILTLKNHLGQVIKKVWRMGARGKTVAKALAFVNKFKPKNAKVQEEIDRKSEDNSASATWVFEHQINDNLIDLTEEIMFVGGGSDFIEGLRVKTPDNPNGTPILHEARGKAGRIIVNGVLRGYADPLVAPSPHFVESESVRRLPREEAVFDTVPENRRMGTFTRKFQEVYIVTDFGGVGSPSHGNHDKLVALKEPADGKVLTFKKT